MWLLQLTYFHGHRFRSRAYVDIGAPITVSPALVAKYNQGKEAKREACTELLNSIQTALHAVTVHAPDYETLELIWAVRRLYKPSSVLASICCLLMVLWSDARLSNEDKLELTRRFEEGYEKLQHDPRVQALSKQVKAYNRYLKDHGLRDHQVTHYHSAFRVNQRNGQQVKTTALGGQRAMLRLLWRLFVLLVYGLFALPGSLPLILLGC